MTAPASLPMPRRTEAAAVAQSQAARPTARAAKPAAAKAGETERPSPRRSPPKTSGNAPGLATQLPSLAFAAVVAAALVYGWQMRDEGHLTPESGVGYWLGIGGASAMLLLGYPLRKRLTGLKILGSVTGWFRIHMMLGVIGPALILLHASSRRSGALASLFALLRLRLTSFGLKARLSRVVKRHLGAEARRLLWSWRVRRRHTRAVHTLLQQYLTAVNKTAAFVFYERLFGLWHVLHLPLFAILLFAAVIHVVAVHLY